MKETVTLEAKDVKAIITKFLGIKEEQVVSLRYNFAVESMTVEQIRQKLSI